MSLSVFTQHCQVRNSVFVRRGIHPTAKDRWLSAEGIVKVNEWLNEVKARWDE